MRHKRKKTKSIKEREGVGSDYKVQFFHSSAHMLLGTHPIPARSPAEKEGQNGE